MTNRIITISCKYSLHCIVLILLCITYSSCSRTKKLQKYKNAQGPLEATKDMKAMEGTKLDSKAAEKLERLISKVEKQRQKRIKYTQASAGKGPRKEKKYQKKSVKSELKEYRYQYKIKKFQKKHILDIQSAEVRKRMKTNQRHANRRAKGKNPEAWWERIF